MGAAATARPARAWSPPPGAVTGWVAAGKPLLAQELGLVSPLWAQLAAVPWYTPHPWGPGVSCGVQDPGDVGQPGAAQSDILHPELCHSAGG